MSIYAFGYNWLQSCGQSAQRLEKRIDEILKWWQTRRHQCKKVILITHSMGGLVGRACAKRIPDKIAGMFHAVMPALGVSQQSGSGPSRKIKQLFATSGYRHQESYKEYDAILLTRYCIVKIVQELEKNGYGK